jgi:hypothetical protein
MESFDSIAVFAMVFNGLGKELDKGIDNADVQLASELPDQEVEEVKETCLSYL